MKLELTSLAEFLSFFCQVFNVSSSTWMPPLFRQSAVVQKNIVTLVSSFTEVVLITRNVILFQFGFWFFCTADLFPSDFSLFSYHSLAGKCKTSYTGLQTCCANIFLSPFCYSWLFKRVWYFTAFLEIVQYYTGQQKMSSYVVQFFFLLHQNWQWTLQYNFSTYPPVIGAAHKFYCAFLQDCVTVLTF